LKSKIEGLDSRFRLSETCYNSVRGQGGQLPNYQKNLFTNRWRGVRLRTPSERELHIALVAELRWTLRPDVEMYHVPSGELRDIRIAAKIKAMGGKRGIPDLVFRWGPPLQLLYLELKRRNGKLSDDQIRFGERARAHGAYFETADTIEGAVSILANRGLLKQPI
jgi:hypothetical protein